MHRLNRRAAFAAPALVLVCLAWPVTVIAESPPEPLAVRVELEDGTIVHGTLVEEYATSLVVESETLGRLEIRRTCIRLLEIDGVDARVRRRWHVDPDYNSHMLVPTSETLPQGTAYYRNFELLFNNVGFGLTDDWNVNLMAMFPVSSEFQLFGFGTKLRVLPRERYGIGAAVAGNVIVADDERLGSLSGIVSVGSKLTSVSMTTGAIFSNDDASAGMFLVGYDLQFARGLKLIVEYGNSADAVFGDDDTTGLINFGIRGFVERMSFTVTALRPLTTDDTDGLLAWPMVSFSSRF